MTQQFGKNNKFFIYIFYILFKSNKCPKTSQNIRPLDIYHPPYMALLPWWTQLSSPWAHLWIHKILRMLIV